jgi:hypothetical protein
MPVVTSERECSFPDGVTPGEDFLLRFPFAFFVIFCGQVLRAYFKITKDAAARDFGCGQGGEGGAPPWRAVTTRFTGHFKTSQSGSNQNQPLSGGLVHIRLFDASKRLFRRNVLAPARCKMV